MYVFFVVFLDGYWWKYFRGPLCEVIGTWGYSAKETERRGCRYQDKNLNVIYGDKTLMHSVLTKKLFLTCIYKQLFTLRYLANAFIQSDIQGTRFISFCYPWESNPLPWGFKHHALLFELLVINYEWLIITTNYCAIYISFVAVYSEVNGFYHCNYCEQSAVSDSWNGTTFLFCHSKLD